MSVAPVPSCNVKDQVSAAEWQTRIVLAGAKAMIAGVTRSAQGMGGALAWPALLHKLDKQDPGYKL